MGADGQLGLADTGTRGNKNKARAAVPYTLRAAVHHTL